MALRVFSFIITLTYYYIKGSQRHLLAPITIYYKYLEQSISRLHLEIRKLIGKAAILGSSVNISKCLEIMEVSLSHSQLLRFTGLKACEAISKFSTLNFLATQLLSPFLQLPLKNSGHLISNETDSEFKKKDFMSNRWGK